jgi:excisionase family DNA binding protein
MRRSAKQNTYRVFSMKKTEFQPEIMNVSSLADYLHCHTTTIYRLLKERKIPAFRVGSDWRFQRAQINQWIEKKQIAR